MENKSVKVLAIDDNADNLVILKALISEVFSEAFILTTTSGKRGIEMALTHDPEVILLDVVMPGMDGFEVCEAIKSDERISDIPVVFVTALKGEKGTRIRALEAGAEAFLSKPVDEAELIAQIRAMCNIKAGRIEKRNKELHLARLVEEQTKELQLTHQATLHLLQDLRKENEARKQSEAALGESEERYRAFFENSMDAILLTQPDGAILSANAAACDMFGMLEEELQKKGRNGLVDKSDGRLIKLLAEREKKGRVRGELRFIRKNGEVFPAELTSAFFTNSSGEKFTSMIIRDITERLTAEQTIENERLLLRTLIDNMPDAIYCKDLLCRKTLVNLTEAHFMGAKSEEEVLGKDDFEVYPKEMAERFYADDQSIIQTGKPLLNREEYIIDEHGKKKWILSSKLPLCNRDGQITGLLGIGRDITDLKRRELVQSMQYNMAAAMVNRKNLRELFEILKDDLSQLMEVENLTLVMMNDETGMLFSPVDFDENEENPQVWPAESSLTGWLIKQREAKLLTHSELGRLALEQNLERYGPEAECWMGVPLFDGEKVVGAIILQSYRNRAAYDSNSVRIMEVVASQLSSYIKRLHAEETALKLTKAVEQSPDSIFITNTKGIIEYVNPRFTEHTGYTADEAIGKTPRLLNSGRHPALYFKKLWDTLLEGKDWHGEMLNRKKDGSLYWENASISPLFNNDGKITHYIAVKEEITEKKKNEEALKYHSALQAVLINIASSFINVHVERLEATINSSLAEMGKFALADRAYIFEYDLEKQVSKNTYEWCAEGITSLRDSQQKLDLECVKDIVGIHQKGDVFYIADTFSLPPEDPFRRLLQPQDITSTIAIPMMEEGKCIGFVGFSWVNEKHEYSEGEKVLLNIFSQMLVSVKMKTRLQRNLIIEKEKAEAADRLKTAFLNNISHEVRTPLNGILGFGNMLMQPDIPQDEKAEYYELLQQSSNRLVNTVTSYMDISLITSGNMLVNKKQFSLHHLLNSLYEEYQEETTKRNVKLELELENDRLDLQIETDAELLKKIFMQLLNNAVKFTKKGTIRLGYILRNNVVECYVHDTGIGIMPAMTHRVFDHFVQEDTDLSRGYEGSGLGLSISKGLVELLGGTISMSSEKGYGTRVFFHLPYNDPGKAEDGCGKDRLVPEQPVVLIAEDDQVNQYYIKTLLKLGKVECVTVLNGKQAIEACRENRNIGLVLMDLKMPGMGGLEATRSIKEFRPGLPVIAVTAHAMKDDAEKALAAGCDDYLAKPFKKEALLEKVKYFLNQRNDGPDLSLEQWKKN